tara:strand:+ start:227 stop:505 length:279 start_codon:yes stop_codon:yes gene_type:complete
MNIKKSISPTMKVLKKNGFVRITYRRYFDNKYDKFMYTENNKGHFSVVLGGYRNHFTLEVRYTEDFDAIKECLTENGIEFESNFGSLINIKY